jgi:hypothetical protein
VAPKGFAQAQEIKAAFNGDKDPHLIAVPVFHFNKALRLMRRANAIFDKMGRGHWGSNGSGFLGSPGQRNSFP